jgi:hypothetical protein
MQGIILVQELIGICWRAEDTGDGMSAAAWVQAGATLAALAVLGLIAWQILLQRRAMLIDVYLRVMDLIDSPEARVERHYVEKHLQEHPELFDTEGWLNLAPDDVSERGIHRRKAENTARRFDQLGLMWRTGFVPEDLISNFYVVPILSSWAGLFSYIRADRDVRGQPGHMWEFENLAWHACRVLKSQPERGLRDLSEVLERDWRVHPLPSRPYKTKRRYLCCIGGRR